MQVRIYRNLHKNGFFSIQAKDSRGVWLVVAHAERVWISNASFDVRESGRLRVIREQRKNVHAFISGELIQARELTLAPGIVGFGDYERNCLAECSELEQAPRGWGIGTKISYNPYVFHSFFTTNGDGAKEGIKSYSGMIFLNTFGAFMVKNMLTP